MNAQALAAGLEGLEPRDLPTPPDAAARIVRACADPAVTGRELERIVGSDPALAAEILRLVNSPLFALRRPVGRLDQALVLLGHRALRHLALVFMAREVLRYPRLRDLDPLPLREDALLRAAAARLLAREAGLDPAEGFTLGLFQDLGLLALLALRPAAARQAGRLRAALPDERLELERELFGLTHDEAGAWLARRWGLPEELVLPVASHHGGGEGLEPALRDRARLAACADWVAAVFAAADAPLALARSRQRVQGWFGLAPARTEELLEALPAEAARDAALLGLELPPLPALEEIRRRGHTPLLGGVQEAGAPPPEERLRRLERALAERERLAEELQRACARLAELSYLDPLTALVHRRRFDTLLVTEVARHGRSLQPLSLIRLRLEGLELLRRRHGGAFVDALLRSAAEVLRRTVRSSDVVARLEEAELAVLLPETPAEGGQVAAERIREGLRGLGLDVPDGEEGAADAVRCLVGGCSWRAGGPAAAPDVAAALLEGAARAQAFGRQAGTVGWLRLP